MRTAYRIVGSSTTKPENLPEGFEIRERLVGDEFQSESGLVFVEAKDGSVVVYKKGLERSNAKLNHSEILGLFRFFGDVAFENYTRKLK